jgi:hypothetical protein
MRSGLLLAFAVVLAVGAAWLLSRRSVPESAPAPAFTPADPGAAPAAAPAELSSELSGEETRVADETVGLEDGKEQDPGARAQAGQGELPAMRDLADVPMAASIDPPHDASEDYFQKKYSGKSAKERKQARDDLKARVDANASGAKAGGLSSDELGAITREMAWLRANP